VQSIDRPGRDAAPDPALAARELGQRVADTFARSMVGGFLYVMGWAVVSVAGRVYSGYFSLGSGISVALLVIAVLRVRYRPPKTDGMAAQRLWFWRYGAIVVASPAVWGAVQAWLLLDPFFDASTRTLSLIATIGYATVFANVYSTSRTLAATGIAVMFVPALVALWSDATQLPIAVTFVLYSGYLVVALIRSHAEYQRRLQLDEALFEQRNRFEILSRLDPLTGLSNRRHFTAMLAEGCRQALASNGALCLLILDIDHFKAVNDRHGHAVGDACLVALSARLVAAFGHEPVLIARLGGEEFAVILPDCSEADALPIAARVRDALSRPLACDGQELSITVSIGVGACDRGRHTDADALYRDVDSALYLAKAQGRNRVQALQDRAVAECSR
jgi:diguanylate cyclase